MFEHFRLENITCLGASLNLVNLVNQVNLQPSTDNSYVVFAPDEHSFNRKSIWESAFWKYNANTATPGQVVDPGT